MRYVVLAADYDETLASHGVIPADTVAALDRLKASGRQLVLVTGRELDDVLKHLPRVELFDRIVAENGAVVYSPADRQTETLGEPPPAAFVAELRRRQVSPLGVGRVIVATWEPNETVVLQTIRDLGLELQVIFNKGAVMVLPPGVNKAVGLERALAQLHLSPHNAVGIGDAENDHAFLTICECSVAVANALPTVKERADFVTPSPQGAGAIELIDLLVESDLDTVTPGVGGRHPIPLGTKHDGQPLTLAPHGTTLLVAGPSGSGKSTIATAILEQLTLRRYQFCLVDPEGDYANLEDAIVLGDNRTPPKVDDVLAVLEKPLTSVVTSLLGLALDDRPAFFENLLARLHTLRSEKGRPHWLVIDEAHHLLPPAWRPSRSLSDMLDNALLITVHPDHLTSAALEPVNVVIAVGPAPHDVLKQFSSAAGTLLPSSPSSAAAEVEALAWMPRGADGLIPFKPDAPRGERLRHRRKYAEGTLGPDKSFYFRGPEKKLRLRSQNLGMFLQMADGVDDETWLYHLRLGDYSQWVRDAIKDGELADEIAAVESSGVSATESRAAIAEAIGRKYTHPS